MSRPPDWKTYEDFAAGIDTNRLPPTDALVGQMLEVDPEDYVRFNPRLSVTSNAPPTFIYHTSDDGLVAPEGSLRFYEALREQNVPVEMHVFEHGAHGTGLGGADASLSTRPQLLQEWMRHRGLLPAPEPVFRQTRRGEHLLRPFSAPPTS